MTFRVLTILFLLSLTAAEAFAQKGARVCAGDRASANSYLADTPRFEQDWQDALRIYDRQLKIPHFCNTMCAIALVKPRFPELARRVAKGATATVDAIVDEKGDVVYIRNIKGPSMFFKSAAEAACSSRFSPLKLNDKKVKFPKTIVYHFIY